jgi:hypothetical protein
VRRALLATALLVVSVCSVAGACGGEAGAPAAPEPAVQPGADATVSDARVDVQQAPPAHLVTLGAVVQDLTDAAPIPNVLVVVEVGGLNQANPAGIGPDGAAVATVAWNPFYQYGGLTDDAGRISIEVPAGAVGLHAFADGYLEGSGGPWDAGPDAGSIPLRFLGALPEAGAPLRPRVHGLTADPLFVAPGAPILFTVVVDSPQTGSLSDQVLLVGPATSQAWALAAPSPAEPGAAYPPGIYSRIIPAPGAVGSYTYDLVAASIGLTTSDRASVVVTVTPNGNVPLVDSGIAGPSDGGLPDGRH